MFVTWVRGAVFLRHTYDKNIKLGLPCVVGIVGSLVRFRGGVLTVSDIVGIDYPHTPLTIKYTKYSAPRGRVVSLDPLFTVNAGFSYCSKRAG